MHKGYSNIIVNCMGAEEGDIRLMDERSISNWVFGNLQVFIEGSWGQVCATNFQAADANVACRQLGFGAGTVAPRPVPPSEREALLRTNVFPEVAVVGASCTGDEARLIDCGAKVQDPNAPLLDYDLLDYYDENVLSRDCQNSNGVGLVVACVAAAQSGAEAGTLDAVLLH